MGLEKKTPFSSTIIRGRDATDKYRPYDCGMAESSFADEPTGNLDPETSWEILDILQEINDIGTTNVMATHNASIVNYLKNVPSLSNMVRSSVTKHEEGTIFTKAQEDH